MRKNSFISKRKDDFVSFLEQWKERIKTIEKKWMVLFVALLLVGIAGIVCVLFFQKEEEFLWITRNSYGEGEKEEILYGEDGEEIRFSVEERQYREEELPEAFAEAFRWARNHMLGDNISSSEVRSQLNLMTELPGGFYGEWISEDPDLIHTDGTLENQSMDTEEEKKVRITLVISYQEETQMEDIYLVVKGPIRTKEEEQIRKVQDTISSIEAGSREESNFSLPSTMEGMTISKEAPKNYSGLFLLLIPIGGFFYLRPRRKAQEERKRRQKALLEEYPLVVNKLVLYLGAGLNLKMSFQTLWKDYTEGIALEKKEKKSDIRKELTILMNELSAGVSENRAYEAFGKRTQESCYQRLTALLIQNHQKGNEGLLKVLREEEEAAFRERIDRAKKEGEEAGTKLLFPMLILLMVVMAIVMAPAIMQFQNY